MVNKQIEEEKARRKDEDGDKVIREAAEKALAAVGTPKGKGKKGKNSGKNSPKGSGKGSQKGSHKGSPSATPPTQAKDKLCRIFASGSFSYGNSCMFANEKILILGATAATLLASVVG